MKTSMIKFGIIVMMFVLISSMATAFSGSGSGTGGDPYVITTCSQLQEINDELDADYILGNDIDCSATTSWNGGTGFIPIGYYDAVWNEFPFIGTFNGMNYTIDGVYENHQSVPGVLLCGVFGWVGGEVRNVGFTNIHINCSYPEESWGTGSVLGLFDGTSNAIADQIYVDGAYLESSCDTGIIGGVTNYYGGTPQITNIYGKNIEIYTRDYDGCAIGGVVGFTNGGTYDNIYIQATYSDDGSSITFSGGMAGKTEGSPVFTDAFYDCTTSGFACSGYGKTTTELQTASTFSGFDTSIWSIADGGYPEFVWIGGSNTAPVINSITPSKRIELKNGETQLYTADVTDTEMDASYSWTIGSTEVSTSETYLADWAFIEPGIYTLTLTVDDGEFQDSASVTLEVRAKGGGGGSSFSIVSEEEPEQDYIVTAVEQQSLWQRIIAWIKGLFR